MKFSEVVAQVVTWLQREGRVSYRALKREFDLDDEFLADVKTEIIEAKRLASDEDGRFLVWTGGATQGETTKRGNGEKGKPAEVVSSPQPLTPHSALPSPEPPSGAS